jgi:hypothetical protein
MRKYGRTGGSDLRRLTLVGCEGGGVDGFFAWEEIEGQRNLRRSVFNMLGGGKSSESKSMPVAEVTHVRRGIQTETFSKAGTLDPYVAQGSTLSIRYDMLLELFSATGWTDGERQPPYPIVSC